MFGKKVYKHLMSATTVFRRLITWNPPIFIVYLLFAQYPNKLMQISTRSSKISRSIYIANPRYNEAAPPNDDTSEYA